MLERLSPAKRNSSTEGGGDSGRVVVVGWKEVEEGDRRRLPAAEGVFERLERIKKIVLV